MTPTSMRPLAGGVAVGLVVVASLLLSPSSVAVIESVSADPYLFGLVVAGLYLVRPLLAWPPTLLSAVVGYGYGVTLGVPIALVGVVVTVIPVFLGVRWITATTAVDSSGGHPEGVLERTGDVVRRYYDATGPIRGVTASRLAPIPSDVSTCAAAVSDVGLGHLVVGTAIGELPWTVAAVVVGASTATITTAGLGDLGAPLSVACALAAALLLAGPIYRLARGRLPSVG